MSRGNEAPDRPADMPTDATANKLSSNKRWTRRMLDDRANLPPLRLAIPTDQGFMVRLKR